MGNSETLVPTIAPGSATNRAVTWSSSDAAKVMVNSAGKITAMAAGSATITVKTNDHAKTATCVVTVTA
ncbi:Ig domain-containing protein [Serratia aquatilis]|uniref:Ig-like domain-containing protein n=1 Tax=Serratia aquatilis TaxID=1737515 RepID=UPI00384EFECC